MRKGFTLIEIIIVVAIISVIIGASVASYGSGARKQNFEKETSSFVDILNSMRSSTVARDVRNLKCSNKVSYFVDVDHASNTYWAYQKCDDATSGVTDTLITASTFKYTRFDSVSKTRIHFIYPYGYLESDVPPDITIDLVSNETNRCKTIQISPIGTIEVTDYDC